MIDVSDIMGCVAYKLHTSLWFNHNLQVKREVTSVSSVYN